jgi:hypothetical protein
MATRMPPFARQIGFDGFAAWLAENGFDAIDTPQLTRRSRKPVNSSDWRSVLPTEERVCLAVMQLSAARALANTRKV